tara:strand:+ start:746 stop:1441 length:696 start_codon:yes stop_codon:yes gene_type:complete
MLGHQRHQISASEGSDSEVTVEMLDESWNRLRALPKLPGRYIWAMRREAVLGCTVVCFLISLLVGLTQGVALAPGASTPKFVSIIVMTLIYAEATIAVGCLFGLMFGDPGEIKRSPDTCFPLPEVVADRISQGQSLEGLNNLAADGRTYCVRCLVWRSDNANVHHCSTCNRCVEAFDHHCGVFGRCIAGDGFGGNMGYFKTIIGMAMAGCVTAFGSVIATMADDVHDRRGN